MSGNGAMTLGTKIIKARHLMEVFGNLVEIKHAGCCAVVVGTIIPGAAAVRSASGILLMPGASFTVSGLQSLSSPGSFLFTLLNLKIC